MSRIKNSIIIFEGTFSLPNKSKNIIVFLNRDTVRHLIFVLKQVDGLEEIMMSSIDRQTRSTVSEYNCMSLEKQD